MNAVARVQLTVEVDVERWGNNHTLGEVIKKAKEEAVEEVRSYRRMGSNTPLRIIGEPKVLTVLVPE